MSEEYLEGCTKEDIAYSKTALKILKDKRLSRFRFNSQRHELYIEFEDGSQIFVDHIPSIESISVISSDE